MSKYGTGGRKSTKGGIPMTITMRKRICLAMTLLCLLTASGGLAAALNPATITMPSSQWEENFQNLLVYAADNDFSLTDNTVFSVAERPALDGTVGYEHSLDLAGFMKVSYFDYGDDLFNSAILTINLDHGGAPVEMALMPLYFTILAGDMDTTQEEFYALLEALCPIFNEVFSGEQRVNGAQTATMRGVGYGMEVNDGERFVRLYTNVSLTQNDP